MANQEVLNTGSTGKGYLKVIYPKWSTLGNNADVSARRGQYKLAVECVSPIRDMNSGSGNHSVNLMRMILGNRGEVLDGGFFGSEDNNHVINLLHHRAGFLEMCIPA